MGEQREAFAGIDVAKRRNAIAVADGERGGEVRYLGAVDASPAGMTRIVRRLAGAAVSSTASPTSRTLPEAPLIHNI